MFTILSYGKQYGTNGKELQEFQTKIRKEIHWATWSGDQNQLRKIL